MIENRFGSIVDFITQSIQSRPRLSVWTAALILSSVWTVFWIIVFFLSTWIFDLKTLASEALCLFWLSISAEAAIRWVENMNFIARLSKPYDKSAIGENWDFKWQKAVVTFLLSIGFMFIIRFIMDKVGMNQIEYTFVGQGDLVGVDPLAEMIKKWYQTGTQAPILAFLVIGTVFRAYIYKRDPKPFSRRIFND